MSLGHCCSLYAPFDLHYMVKSLWTPLSSHSYVLFECAIPDLVPLCCYYNLHFSRKDFHQIFGVRVCGFVLIQPREHSCSQALLLGEEAWGTFYIHSSASQKYSVELRSGLCAGHSSSATPSLANHVVMDLTLYTGELSCWNRFGLDPLIPVKGNYATVYKAILYNCVPAVWGKNTYVVRCSQTFGYIVYIK